MPGERWTPQEDSIMLSLCESGKSYVHVANILGKSSGETVRKHYNRVAGHPRPRMVRITPAQADAIARARAAGWTWGRIAERVGMTESQLYGSVQRAAKRKEIPWIA